MASYYGIIQGNRGEASRCGSRDIRAIVKSWRNTVTVILGLQDGKDFCYITIPKGLKYKIERV